MYANASRRQHLYPSKSARNVRNLIVSKSNDRRRRRGRHRFHRRSRRSSHPPALLRSRPWRRRRTSRRLSPLLVSLIVAEFVLLLLPFRLPNTRGITRTTRQLGGRRIAAAAAVVVCTIVLCRCRCAGLDEIVVIPVSFRSAFSESVLRTASSLVSSRSTSIANFFTKA